MRAWASKLIGGQWEMGIETQKTQQSIGRKEGTKKQPRDGEGYRQRRRRELEKDIDIGERERGCGAMVREGLTMFPVQRSSSLPGLIGSSPPPQRQRRQPSLLLLDPQP